jgi:hypothetical protein
MVGGRGHGQGEWETIDLHVPKAIYPLLQLTRFYSTHIIRGPRLRLDSLAWKTMN